MPRSGTDSKRIAYDHQNERSQPSNSRKGVAVFFLFTAFFWHFLSVASLRADEFRLLPFITLRGEYNDNIFFSFTENRTTGFPPFHRACAL